MKKTFRYDNSDISYSVDGSGNPVVLLHGFGEDRSIWTAQNDFLKDKCMVLTLDLPGSGLSGILEEDDAAIDDFANVVNAMLEQENIDKCVTIGHSMGGYIALAFAEKYAEKLNGFGFVNSTAFADSEEKKASRRQGIKMIKEHGAFAFLKNSIPGLFSKSFKKQHNNKVVALIEKGKEFSIEALVQYYNAMMNRSDRTQVLKEAIIPVLFILGSEDNAAPLNDLLQQVHLPKVAYIHILEGVGHMSMMEEEEKVNNYILEFVQDC